MDMPEVLGTRIAREFCSFHSSTERSYVLTFERPIYDGIPERCALFPVSLREEQRGEGYVLHAEYHDGSTEDFVSFEEICFRFSARMVEMTDDARGMIAECLGMTDEEAN